jgi:hypothetical protein
MVVVFFPHQCLKRHWFVQSPAVKNIWQEIITLKQCRSIEDIVAKKKRQCKEESLKNPEA